MNKNEKTLLNEDGAEWAEDLPKRKVQPSQRIRKKRGGRKRPPWNPRKFGEPIPAPVPPKKPEDGEPIEQDPKTPFTVPVGGKKTKKPQRRGRVTKKTDDSGGGKGTQSTWNQEKESPEASQSSQGDSAKEGDEVETRPGYSYEYPAEVHKGIIIYSDWLARIFALSQGGKMYGFEGATSSGKPVDWKREFVQEYTSKDAFLKLYNDHKSRKTDADEVDRMDRLVDAKTAWQQYTTTHGQLGKVMHSQRPASVDAFQTAADIGAVAIGDYQKDERTKGYALLMGWLMMDQLMEKSELAVDDESRQSRSGEELVKLCKRVDKYLASWSGQQPSGYEGWLASPVAPVLAQIFLFSSKADITESFFPKLYSVFKNNAPGLALEDPAERGWVGRYERWEKETYSGNEETSSDGDGKSAEKAPTVVPSVPSTPGMGGLPGANENKNYNYKPKGVRNMDKDAIKKIIKEAFTDNVYGKYPYSVKDEDDKEPAEDYLEVWKNFSKQVCQDPLKHRAIQLCRALIKDTALLMDVLEALADNQSIGTAILAKMEQEPPVSLGADTQVARPSSENDWSSPYYAE